MSGSIAAFVLWTSLSVAPECAGDDPPPIFDKRPYAEARKAAETAKKWFVVKATATWCAPCKQMDKTTWRDPNVVKWMQDNGIVVALDVDQENKVAAELAVESMPTMIAFKDGKEFDRIVGYKSPEDLLTWLQGIARGEKAIEGVKKRVAGGPGKAEDVRARMELAKALAQERQFVEAADEYVWLWQHMLEHEPAMYGVRLSFMASDMQRLASRDPAARTRFVTLRDQVGKALEQEKVEMDAVVDWVALNNRVLGDTDATVSWYTKVREQPRWRPIIQRVASDLVDMFIAQKRWAEVGNLSRDPLADLEGEVELIKLTKAHGPTKGLDEATQKMLEEMPARRLREKAGQFYAGLLAANREDLAGKLAQRSREIDGSPAMVRALVGTALKAEQPRAAHAAWLKAAANDDPSLADLQKEVAAALAKKAEQPVKPDSGK